MRNFLLSLLFITGCIINGNSQEITMFPGFFSVKYYQDDVRISKSQVANLMMSQPESNKYWKKAKSQNTTAWLLLGAQAGMLVWQVNRINNNEDYTTPQIAGLACGVGVIGFALSSSSNQKKAILSYNKAVKKQKKETTYFMGTTANGLGLVIRF